MTPRATPRTTPRATPRAPHVALTALLALSAGCGPRTVTPDAAYDAAVYDAAGDGADAACDPNGATIALGTSYDTSFLSFHPLVDGTMVYLTPGPQGGQHIWVALRGRGLDPTQPRIELRAWRPADGTLLGLLRIRLPMTVAPEDPTLLAMPRQQLALDDDQYCSVLPGDVRITLDFNDGQGHCLHREATVHLAGLDPNALMIDADARRQCCAQHLRRCYPDAGVPAGDAGAGPAPDVLPDSVDAP